MLPGYYDGPSHTLLEVINNLNGKAPLTWQGFRILTEKWFVFKFLINI